MSSTRRILILGGYGNTGRPLAACLLQITNVELRLAGRDLAKGQGLAAQLNEIFGAGRVTAVQADASQAESLRRAFSDIDLVAVASSTVDYTANVARAALEAGIDYLDVQYSAAKLRTLQALAGEVAASGCLFITDGGFHPGLPAALIRYAAPHFDRLERATVASVIKIDWSRLEFSPSTMEEFAAEFIGMQMLAYHDGRWQAMGWLEMMKPQSVLFPEPFGRQYAIPMFLEEMRAIPDLYPQIRETGFFVGGFNWVTDWLVSPLVMIGLKIAPRRGRRPLGRLLTWSLRAFGKPPYGTMLKLEARGIKDGQPQAVDLLVAHEDGYWLTAVPAAACLFQYLDGRLPQSGLYFQAQVVEPERFIDDIAGLGVRVAGREKLAPASAPT